jgi:protein-disulfide isomerase
MPADSNRIQKKSGKWPLITALIFLILVIIIGYWYSRTANKLQTAGPSKNKAVDAVEEIKALNRDAIDTAQTAPARPVRPVDETDHVWGDIKAPVQFIVYDDFECPFCAEFYVTLKQVKEHFGDQVVIAFRHYPLTIHPLAVPAALAVECAAEQGKFWEMYDKLFTANLANKFTPLEFQNAAAELDLDAPKFNQCLETEKYLEKVQMQMLEGRNYDVIGAPGNFINSIPWPGAVPFEDFTDSAGNAREGLKTIIERELQK